MYCCSHPPLGKLVFWAVCKLTGYDWEKCGFANIADEFAPDCKFMVIRYTAATFGTVTAPLFYWIVRNWGGSILAAILASVAFITDGLNVTEDRLILTDSQLIFWIAVSLLSAQVRGKHQKMLHCKGLGISSSLKTSSLQL